MTGSEGVRLLDSLWPTYILDRLCTGYHSFPVADVPMQVVWDSTCSRKKLSFPLSSAAISSHPRLRFVLATSSTFRAIHCLEWARAIILFVNTCYISRSGFGGNIQTVALFRFSV